jgi:hypothetical protein
MVVVKSLNEYEICTAEESDYDSMYTVLQEAVVGVAGTANSRMRKSRILKARISNAIQKSNLIALMHLGKPVAACIIDNRRASMLVNINVLKEYRILPKTGLLMHYIVNNVFTGKAVYFMDTTNQFTSIGELVDTNIYKVKDTVAAILLKLYGDI